MHYKIPNDKLQDPNKNTNHKTQDPNENPNFKLQIIGLFSGIYFLVLVFWFLWFIRVISFQ